MVQAELKFEDVEYIAKNMREWDKREIYASHWHDDPTELAKETMPHHLFAWTFGLDRPIAAVGAICMWPGVWTVWMFATDEFHLIALPLTKFIKRKMMPALYPFAHRVECKTIEGHKEAQKWLDMLGAKREDGILEKYGKNKDNFIVYRWFKEDVITRG